MPWRRITDDPEGVDENPDDVEGQATEDVEGHRAARRTDPTGPKADDAESEEEDVEGHGKLRG